MKEESRWQCHKHKDSEWILSKPPYWDVVTYGWKIYE